MKKFLVTHYYSTYDEIEVEANNEQEAIKKALSNESHLKKNLQWQDSDVKEANK